ncbi:MAG: hypothetical protein ACR2K2_09980 [Mycobacteriales bacterium]
MSRGPGVVQRSVLDALLDQPTGPCVGWLTAAELTQHVFGGHSSRAQVESVRRAMKTLAEAGTVELDYLPELTPVRATRYAAGDGMVHRVGYHGNRGLLAAHLALSVEERRARRQYLDDLLERLVALDARIGRTTP